MPRIDLYLLGVVILLMQIAILIHVTYPKEPNYDEIIDLAIEKYQQKVLTVEEPAEVFRYFNRMVQHRMDEARWIAAATEYLRPILEREAAR